MNKTRSLTRYCKILLGGAGLMAASQVLAQFCPVATTYFATNYFACTVGSCWSATAFSGSTAVTGAYPSTNYACATTAPVAGARENTLYGYDNNGNLTTSKNPLGHTTTHSYDALNRLTQMLDPANGTTKYGYAANHGLTQVTDPRNLPTNYTLNGFGETLVQASPDTGNTTHTYDATGNLTTKLDARGVTATYSYDGINRVTNVVYSKTGTSTETHTFTYDAGTNGKGRLTKVVDPAGTTSWTYSPHGRVLSKTQTVGSTKTVAYTYNAVGQLATLTTPSGQLLSYTYSNGRVGGITLNGAPLLSGAASEPFGPLSAWQWGNGLLTFRDYDLNGRIRSWELRNDASLLRHDLTWDRAGRLTAIANPLAAALACAFQYDHLDRLTVAQRGNPITSTQQFGYDAVGNRVNQTLEASLTNYSYAAGSNQLLALTGAQVRSYVYDAAGNPTTSGGLTYVYNHANRLVTVKTGATTVASYKVNALGQRVQKVQKVVGNATSRYVYDEQGRLLGEYDATGKLLQETVWLDDLPVATLRPGPGKSITPYYVHADHLGSPRAVTRPSDNQVVWRWDNVDPFGANAANENPSGLGVFKYALRFPGQYFDAETGLHYNYFRDYDPTIGRYQQSDPIGLKGGLNTYAYALNRPTDESDATGLAVWQCFRSMSGIPVGNHTYFFDDKTKQCCGNPGWGRDVRNPRSKCNEGGPGKDVCVLISSNDSDSEKLLNCCNKVSNPWTYFPGINDCQNTADDCIRSIGMAPSAAPNENRFRSCDSCRRTPNNPRAPPIY